MSDKPPNVLFLMSDEHRPDVASYEGNGVVRTPTLDWLAEGGVVFANAYTPAPIHHRELTNHRFNESGASRRTAPPSAYRPTDSLIH